MTTPLNTESIDRFMARVSQAFRTRSKDVRLSMEDAQELSATMGQVLARLTTLQEREIAQTEIITISLDGGTFGD